MKITMYTIPNDPFCKQAMDYLKAKNLQFEEKDVQNNKDLLSELLEKSNKFAGVPFTLMEEGGKTIPLKGFTQSEFDAAVAELQGGAGVATAGMSAGDVKPMDTMKPADDAKPAMDKPAMGMPAMMGSADTMNPAPSTGMPSMNVGMDAKPAMGMPAMPSVPSLDSAMPMGDKSAPTVGGAPVSDMATSMPSVSSAQMGDMPAAPAMPAAGMSSAPAAPAAPAMDPQAELNNILKDLQGKTDMPATPNAGMSSTPSAPTPAAPAAGAMPDFSKPQQ